ncbi:MAG: hypothetical protein HZA50_05500 [Planctomycetes bacterium]|nr:hypothetical protein [Planctomycetota bacterium]
MIDRTGWTWSDNTSFRRSMAFLAMLAIGLACRATYPSDWDSWDYTSMAVAGHSSHLFLGRWWFIAFMRVVYLFFHSIWGLTPLQAHIPMQITCAVMAAAIVPLLMAWIFRLTGNRRTELFAGLLMITAPLMCIYSAAVMTEGLTCLALVAAMYAWQRAVDYRAKIVQTDNAETHTLSTTAGQSKPLATARFWAIAAGLAFGIASDVREPLIVMGIWPIISLFVYKPQKPLILFLYAVVGLLMSLGIGITGAVAWCPYKTGFLGGLDYWIAYMADRKATIPLSFLKNLSLIADYSFISAPNVAILIIPAAIWSAFKNRCLLALTASSLVFIMWLMSNFDLLYQPRYVLPLMWLICPVVASMLSRLAEIHLIWRNKSAAVLAAGLLCLGASVAISKADLYYAYYYIHAENRGRILPDMLELPDDATLVAGQALPVAQYLNRMGIKKFDAICLGVSCKFWTIQDAVNDVLKNGGTVYATLRPEDWIGHAWPGGPLEHLKTIAQGCEVEHVAGSFVRMKLPVAATTRPTAGQN